jgi:hypothetical protein
MTAKPESGRKLGAPTGEQDNNIKININHLRPSVYFMYQQVLHSAFSVHLCILYGSIFLPVVLYGCETWSLTIMEDHRLRVFENIVLEKIFVRKWNEVTEE